MTYRVGKLANKTTGAPDWISILPASRNEGVTTFLVIYEPENRWVEHYDNWYAALKAAQEHKP